MSIQDAYDRIAHVYDRDSRIPNLVGFRDRHYHRVAVDMLQAGAGDVVVVIGCGTGIDFERIEAAIGPTGTIHGVDLSERMLDQARIKAKKNGWDNIQFWHGDAADYPWPREVDHVLASFTLKFQPDHSDVIHAAHRHMRPGGRFAMADFHLHKGLRPFGRLLLRRFGHTDESLDRRPEAVLRQLFDDVVERRFWFGGAYALVGTKSAPD